MRVYFEDIAGVPTRYFRAGSGPVVLLLHGVGVTADSWCKTMPALAQDFTVVAPDLLDNGFTGADSYTGGPPHDAILDHLTALVDALGIEHFHIVGSSFGAALSVLLYLRLRGRVTRLVLVSSGSLLMEPEDLVAMYGQSYENGRSALIDPTVENCRRRLAKIFYDPDAIPEEYLLLQLTPYALPNALGSFERRLKGMQDLEKMRSYRVVHRLEEIDVPTLAVWGKNDPRGAYALAEQHLGRIPDVTVVAFDKCGHMPHLEQSEAFNRAAGDFLRH